MPFADLRRIVTDLYGPALVLRSVFPSAERDRVRRNVFAGCVVTLILLGILFALSRSPLVAIPMVHGLTGLEPKVWGVLLVLFSVAYLVSVLDAFHRSYYFHGIELVLEEGSRAHVPVAWEVATLVADTREDVTRAFLDSKYGREVLYRAGVPDEAFVRYHAAERPPLIPEVFMVGGDESVTLATYAQSLYKQDQTFRQLLAEQAISIDHLTQAAAWASDIEHERRYRARWWSRDNLGRISGLGKTWAYGETHHIERYGHDLVEDPIWHAATMTRRAERDEVEAMERVLCRARQSNVLLVATDMMAIRASVAQLYHKIRSGRVLPPLEGHRIFLVDLEVIAMATRTKAAFETTLSELLSEAVRAGNVVIYLEQFAEAVESARSFDTDLVALLQPYAESSALQLIVGALPEGYHSTLARDTRLLQTCDVVHLHSADEAALLDLLEQRAYRRETQSGVTFTVPALHAIMRLADQYFPAGVMPDKAFDLFEELIPYAITRDTPHVLQADVEAFVRGKTGAPVGAPTHEEQGKLLSLEAFLHKRVVGQDRAVGAVARALRRARAGVEHAKKPAGSFLFLGPTGVGKTETAKALAEALYRNERHMVRLDMSEYSGEEALGELLGSYESGKPGRFAALIEERPYGVLLLDEFEKSDRAVHDLFLQILDEGYVTTAAGKHIDLRNFIIIATSNAGAELVWTWEREGKNIATLKREFIDHLIATHLFRPELLNRFDDIVLFHTLSKEEVCEIARAHLRAFSERLEREHGIRCSYDEGLIAAVTALGYDPQLGGRPLERAVKETVAQVVADRMLAGTLVPGQEVTLHAHDIGR